MKWTEDAGSLAIFGRTQVGKTTLARQLHDNRRISIWINQDSEPVRGIPKGGHGPVRTLRGVESRLADGATEIELRTSSPAGVLSDVADYAFAKAEEHDRQAELQIIVDEIHEVAPQTNENVNIGRDAARKIAKRGQKRNVKLIGITQDPVSTDKQWIRQTSYVALFRNHFSQESSLRNLNLPFQRAQNLPEYACLVVDATGDIITPENGVVADSKYAV